LSHDATNWAIRQKGLKPATKIVLWHLCDRHHPDNGCFPKQETLAADCEMSRSTLNLHLAKLEELGLIRRDAGREQGTMKHRPTRYWLAFEGENTASENRTKTMSENRTEAPKTVSEKTQKPCPKNAGNRVLNSDTNSVREPLREPVIDAAPPKRRRPEVPIPPEWVPSDRNISDAQARQFTAQEIADEADRFRNHHLARDTRFRDWDAAWRTWLGNARRFAPRGGTPAKGGGMVEAFAAVAAARSGRA